jgi:hypothetical protein
MNPDFNYNHDKSNLDEALGLEKDFSENLTKKIVLITSTLADKETLSISTIVEEMVAICSSEQIALLAAFYIKGQLDGFIEKIKEKE